jgi:hypothetical protein
MPIVVEKPNLRVSNSQSDIMDIRDYNSFTTRDLYH